MLKIAGLAMGLLTVVTIAPNAEAKSFQIERVREASRREARYQGGRTRADVNGQLHAEKLIPLKKLGKLSPAVIKGTSVGVLKNRTIELSTQSKERDRIKTACQQQFDKSDPLKSNQRIVGIIDHSRVTPVNTPANSVSNFETQGGCGFSGSF